MQRQKYLVSYSWIQTSSGVIQDQEGRCTQKSSRESSLPLVASTQVLYSLEKMLLHVKQFGQVEYLLKHLFVGEAFELA